MGTSIEIPDGLFERLQKHAIPFVDTTPVSVIERLVKYFEVQSAKVDGEKERLNRCLRKVREVQNANLILAVLQTYSIRLSVENLGECTSHAGTT